nr:MAG TPA: hypothetical protein [Podoviridae sp. ctY3D12]
MYKLSIEFPRTIQGYQTLIYKIHRTFYDSLYLHQFH